MDDVKATEADTFSQEVRGGIVDVLAARMRGK